MLRRSLIAALALLAAGPLTAQATQKAPPIPADKAAAFESVDLAISLTYDAWVGLLKSVDAAVACREAEPFQKALQQALASGGVKVLKGTPAAVQSFFRDDFDPPQTTFQALTLR